MKYIRERGKAKVQTQRTLGTEKLVYSQTQITLGILAKCFAKVLANVASLSRGLRGDRAGGPGLREGRAVLGLREAPLEVLLARVPVPAPG